MVKARLTKAQRDLLLEYAFFVDPKFLEGLREKKSYKGYVSIEINGRDLLELIGCIASEANHAKKRETAAALNALCDELESLAEI